MKRAAVRSSHNALLYIVLAYPFFKQTGRAAIRLARYILALFFTLLPALAASAAEERITVPPGLQRDVDFWVRVYSEISTSEGFLHDDRDLSLVYRKLKFNRDVTPRLRREAVEAEREKVEAMLKRLAGGAKDLTAEEQALADMFGPDATASRYAEAARQVRFQLGQADRFREGLERSGAWEPHIAATFARLGLPPELAALPHVESSFDPSAYSKVGAAGLWQFMRSTGRLYMRVDSAVDERLDPFRATEAAAQLLDSNYRFLDSWPLALTAYNHGAAGMRRARDSMGTADITTIVRNYSSKSFGFASRNFFVSFLAALTIDRNPEKYFAGIVRQPAVSFTELEMPAFVPLSSLVKTLKVDKGELLTLNPALLKPVRDDRQYVPKGYKLRLPEQAKHWTALSLTQQLDPQSQYANQPRARSYRVKAGDTLASVAGKNGVSAAALARLNGLAEGSTLRPKATLQLPDVPATRIVLAEQRAEERAVAAVRKQEPEPVTAAEAKAQGPALAPGVVAASPGDAIDYTISADNRIRVAAEETLGRYAEWLEVPVSRLRSLNKLSGSATASLGRMLQLDFSRVSREKFDGRRREFHDSLQATFFAAHRVVGTQAYVVRPGDSLWIVSQRHGSLPAWLVLHYNPDINFNALRAGQRILIPKVEALPV